MNSLTTVAVIGGGNGAFAAAVHLTLRGLRVNLCWPRNAGQTLRPLLDGRGLNYIGVLGEGTVHLNRITARVDEALADADIIMVCVPSPAHGVVASWLAPFLRPGATILLNPGHTGGALHFRQALSDAGFSGELILGETNTLTYISRKSDPRTVNITSVVKSVRVAALPAARLEALLEKVRVCYPDLQPTKTVLGTSLRNLNAIMHPPGMLLSAAWIEHTGGDFYFYYDAATPAVARLMQAIDDERLAIAAAWDEPMEPLIDILAEIGTTTHEARDSGSLQQAFLESKPNRWLKAPPSLDHRYMHEDFPYGLVPMVALGRAAGVASPIMSSMIGIASIITGVDYWSDGLNLERLGLSRMRPEAIRSLLERGS